MTIKTILIADDDHDLVDVLGARCRELGLTVVVAYDARTALTLACQSRPDLICLDVNMPSGSGLGVCEMLSSDENLASVPVIMLTSSSEPETIRRCHQMCAYYVLKSRDVWERLQPILCELLEIDPRGANPPASTDDATHESPLDPTGNHVSLDPQRHGLDYVLEVIEQMAVKVDTLQKPAQGRSPGPEPSRRPRVLYVEDDVATSNALKIRAESLGLELIQAFNGTEGYRLAVAKEPDVILCDFVMPEGQGDYALRRFQENPVTENIPVIFLTGRQGADLRRRLYAQGAAGFLSKPVDFEELVHELGRFIKIDPPRQQGTVPARPLPLSGTPGDSAPSEDHGPSALTPHM